MDKELEALPAGVSCSSIRLLNFVKLNEVKKGSYSAVLVAFAICGLNNTSLLSLHRKLYLFR